MLLFITVSFYYMIAYFHYFHRIVFIQFYFKNNLFYYVFMFILVTIP